MVSNSPLKSIFEYVPSALSIDSCEETSSFDVLEESATIESNGRGGKYDVYFSDNGLT